MAGTSVLADPKADGAAKTLARAKLGVIAVVDRDGVMKGFFRTVRPIDLE